ncbi:hypothetical protein LEP1GSC188_3232 [Leptospira weilii serovar Topaz str. LT2116]|uniref:Uncharacterized protein n=1 Tax=Leptospira weilii serovar Topaz str. LT2116 TaxID=1088540 RepID=M3H5K4_9LEPT|nr:hypothetical protein LEP1GSC188_3232 [Leptospira weilii serovar Topaz str. LT2116]
MSYIEGIEFKLESILPEKVYLSESEKTGVFAVDSGLPNP